MYDPPLEVLAARDHMTHLVYQMMQPQVLYDRLGSIALLHMVHSKFLLIVEFDWA